MDYIIKTEGVTRCFKTRGEDFWALKGIDVAVPAGKLTILRGRSGQETVVGKTVQWYNYANGKKGYRRIFPEVGIDEKKRSEEPEETA